MALTFNASTFRQPVIFNGLSRVVDPAAKDAFVINAQLWRDFQKGVLTITGTLDVTNGGTGFSSYTVGDILYSDTTTTLAKLADVATGNVLISGGVGVAPSWGKVSLTTAVSGTLPVANGGTGAGTLADGGLLIGNVTSAVDVVAAGATTELLVGGGALTAPVWTTATGSGAPVRALNPTLTGTTNVDLLQGNGLFQKQSVADTVTLTIPVGYSMVVAGDFTVIGDLIINGDMRVM